MKKNQNMQQNDNSVIIPKANDNIMDKNSKNKKVSKKAIIVAVLVVIICAFLFMNRMRNQESEIISVKTANIEIGDVEAYLSTTANIQSNYVKEYYSSANAKVERVAVKVGDNVKTGQLLVTYEAQDYSDNITQNQIQYENAVMSKEDLVGQNKNAQDIVDDYNFKIKEYENEINEFQLEADNLVLENEDNSKDVKIDEINGQISALELQIETIENQRDSVKFISNTQLKQASNSIELAKINLDSAKEMRDEAVNTIVAEKDGVVTAVYSEEGAIDNTGMKALQVMDVKDLKAVVYVNKYEANSIEIGDKAFITNGGKEYDGEVSFIAPNAENDTATLKVEIKIANADKSLKVNFDTDIDILTDSTTNVIITPVEAIKTDKTGRAFVYVLLEGLAVEKDVAIGIQSDTMAEILEGLIVGEEVILNASTDIVDGTMVTTENSSTPKGDSLFQNMKNSRQETDSEE